MAIIHAFNGGGRLIAGVSRTLHVAAAVGLAPAAAAHTAFAVHAAAAVAAPRQRRRAAATVASVNRGIT